MAALYRSHYSRTTFIADPAVKTDKPLSLFYFMNVSLATYPY